jgi:hypothetical protein
VDLPGCRPLYRFQQIRHATSEKIHRRRITQNENERVPQALADRPYALAASFTAFRLFLALAPGGIALVEGGVGFDGFSNSSKVQL